MRLLGWMIGAMLSLMPVAATADELTERIAAAYELGRSDGYNEGWNACIQQSCVMFRFPVGSGGTSGGGSAISAATTYQVPPIFFGGGSAGGTVGHELPGDWLVNATPSGPGLVGRVDMEGVFQPYVADPMGRIDLLPLAEVPVWTTEDGAKAFFKSLPRGPEGLVYVPLEPAL